jgi:hypothetical protein
VSKNPRFVLGLTAGDIDTIMRSPVDSGTLRDPDLRIVRMPVQEADELIRSLEGSELLRVGEVLMRSPFDRSEYINLSNAPSQVALVKFNLMTLLCSLLGAKSIRLEQLEKISTTGNFETRLNFSALNFESGITNEEVLTMVNSIAHNVTFSGGSPDLAAAEELLGKAGLTRDITFRSLIELRRANNSVQTMSQRLNLTSEVRSSLEMFSKIRFPVKLGEIYPALNTKTHTVSEYTLSMTVEF